MVVDVGLVNGVAATGAQMPVAGVVDATVGRGLLLIEAKEDALELLAALGAASAGTLSGGNFLSQCLWPGEKVVLEDTCD